MQWSQLADDEPRLAEVGQHRLFDPGVVIVATIRRDGTPRISPVEPLLWRGDVWLSMLFGSRKAQDLQRDQRILVHSIVTAREGTLGEFKVRGHAVAESAEATHEQYAEQVRNRLGWNPTPGRFHLFRIDITDITFIRYDDETGDQFVTRWPRKLEFVRRGTSATTVGVTEPFHDLLGGARPQQPSTPSQR